MSTSPDWSAVTDVTAEGVVATVAESASTITAQPAVRRLDSVSASHRTVGCTLNTYFGLKAE